MHCIQLQLSLNSINLQLNESSVTNWVEQRINHPLLFRVILVVHLNRKNHRICDGAGGSISITGTCTAASCFGWQNNSCFIFAIMLLRNLAFIMKNRWVGHTASFTHLPVLTSSWRVAVAERQPKHILASRTNVFLSLSVFLKLEQFSRLCCWLLQNGPGEHGGDCSSGGVAFEEKLLALLTLLPLLLLLLQLVNSFFLSSLRASGENTGSVANAVSCVSNLTTLWNVTSLSSDAKILLPKLRHLTPMLLGNLEVTLLRVSSKLSPSMYLRVFMACSQITMKSSNCWKCMPSSSLIGAKRSVYPCRPVHYNKDGRTVPLTPF